MSNRGWVYLHRSMLDNPLWLSEPFSSAQAWIDLILLANHEDKPIRVGQYDLTVHKGQHFTSIVKLAQRWGWSRGRTNRFMNYLIRAHMIYKERTCNGTLITLVKYGDFQDPWTSKRTSNEQPSVQQAVQPAVQRTVHKQNTKNTLDTTIKPLRKKNPAPPVRGGEWQ